MEKRRIGTFLTIIGKVSVVADRNSVLAVYLPSDNLPNIESGTTPVMEEAIGEISEYLNGSRKVFTVPVSPEGTEFQKIVWDAMTDIPYGSTASYGEIAEYIGHPRSARAVGTACGCNPIPIIIPCHRVVASDGLGGYSGGLAIKKKLLEIERTFR